MVNGACAACRHQKKRCPPNCPLAPYFPSNKLDDFMCVHRLYGVNNVIKMLGNVSDHEKGKTAETLIMEAKFRRDNPVYGSLAVKHQLEAEISAGRRELGFVQNQLTYWKNVTEAQRQKEKLEAQLDKCPLPLVYLPALEKNVGDGSVSQPSVNN